MDENSERNKGQEDVGLYDKLASRTAELLETGRKTLDEALKKAGEELSSAGEYTREQSEKISEYIRRDLKQMEKSARKAGGAIKTAVDPQRMGAGAQSVMARILRCVADTVSELAERAEKQLEYKTGEVTSPGTLTCMECGAEMHFTATVRIPPCPKCYKTRFRKSY